MSYGLVLGFDTDSAEFVQGFEAARVWMTLQHTDERRFTVHWANAEMMLRIGEALDLAVTADRLDDTWAEVTFT